MGVRGGGKPPRQTRIPRRIELGDSSTKSVVDDAEGEGEGKLPVETSSYAFRAICNHI